MDEDLKKIKAWLGAGSINLFGLPFAGKDTQCRLLAEMLGGVVVSGGDILRSYHDQEKIDKLMATGELVPIDFYLSIMIPFLSQPNLKGKPLILSSVGRWHGEEPGIMDGAAQSGHPLEAVVMLTMSEDEVWKRFDKAKSLGDRGRRLDDSREAIVTRLQEFREKTMPAIEFYRGQGFLIEVDGAGSREEVKGGIISSLAARASA